MRFYVVLTLLLLVSAAALAEPPKGFEPLNLRINPASAPIIHLENPNKTKNDYLKIYSENCLQSNNTPALKAYKQRQCACTVAEMSQSMNVDELRAMFENTKEGSFEYARMLLLSYVPCLGLTVKDFIYDSCVGDKNMQTKLQNEQKVCQCISQKMQEHINENGMNVVPGFVRSGFRKEDSVNDILGYVISSQGFQMKSNTNTRNCIRLNE